MQKSKLLTIIGVMLAVVVASLTLVFAVGPRVSADDSTIVDVIETQYFDIDEDTHTLNGLSAEGVSFIDGRKFRVEIPVSVSLIGKNAFKDCTNLVSIYFPATVTSISMDADNFSILCNCPNLTMITVDPGNPKYTSQDDDGHEINGIIDKIENSLVVGCCNTKIPNTVTSIGAMAFDTCGTLTSIKIPSSVTSIGTYAFYECGLTSINLPVGLLTVGESVFYKTLLTSVTIPNTVISIGPQAFSGCEYLISVRIPASVTSLGEHVFGNFDENSSDLCRRLSEIVVGSNELLNHPNLQEYKNQGVDVRLGTAEEFVIPDEPEDPTENENNENQTQTPVNYERTNHVVKTKTEQDVVVASSVAGTVSGVAGLGLGALFGATIMKKRRKF